MSHFQSAEKKDSFPNDNFILFQFKNAAQSQMQTSSCMCVMELYATETFPFDDKIIKLNK